MGFTTKGFRPLRTQLRIEGGVDSQILTDTLVLDGASGHYQSIDPDGTASVTVTLPAEDISSGLFFVIRNSGTGDGVIDVQNDSPATVVELLNGDSVILACDGTTWIAYAVAKPTPGVTDHFLSSNLILPSDAYEYQRIDPNGSNRVITLPAAAANKNRTFHFSNFADGAENLDIGGVVTINQNEAVRIVSTGASWIHLGVYTIALT